MLRRMFVSKGEEENGEKYKMRHFNSWGSIIFEMLTVAKLFKKFLVLYRTERPELKKNRHNLYSTYYFQSD